MEALHCRYQNRRAWWYYCYRYYCYRCRYYCYYRPRVYSVEPLLEEAGGFGLEGVGDDESEQPVKSVQSIAADKRRAANFLFMKIPP